MYLRKHMITLEDIVKGKLDQADENTLIECIDGKYKNNLADPENGRGS